MVCREVDILGPIKFTNWLMPLDSILIRKFRKGSMLRYLSA